MSDKRFVEVVCWLVIAMLVGTGAWAFLAPHSFYENVAFFPPYNRHLVHDLGAFSVGLGSTLVLALLRWTGLRLALGAAAIGNVVHAVSHIVDRDIGGRSSDPWSLSALAVLTVVAAAVAGRLEREEEHATA